ncbi:hypothetical protein [Arcanobacterium bovis]|uniref:Centromere-binding protein ParB C-terminal domain-containing protein n=1 Tax=Arcanobacterium bovis TaxID=2529275 RepID=A0A4V2KR46_9ACTO|nr:hypothetical protein [Arcanobacterium bovis]TBW20697.1 hypothetical protein EZJ44_08520 [Arcanobacterium bovis]
MKTPDPHVLSKATINDPIIAGNASEAGSAVSASNASHASTAGRASESVDVPVKFTIRLPKTLMGRIRAAYLADLTEGGAPTLSEWAAEHLAQAVNESEQRVNGGAQFRPVGTGRVPRLPLSGRN